MTGIAEAAPFSLLTGLPSQWPTTCMISTAAPETGGLDSKPNSTLAHHRHISLLLLRKVGTILAPTAHRGLGIP